MCNSLVYYFSTWKTWFGRDKKHEHKNRHPTIVGYWYTNTRHKWFTNVYMCMNNWCWCAVEQNNAYFIGEITSKVIPNRLVSFIRLASFQCATYLMLSLTPHAPHPIQMVHYVISVCSSCGFLHYHLIDCFFPTFICIWHTNKTVSWNVLFSLCFNFGHLLQCVC